MDGSWYKTQRVPCCFSCQSFYVDNILMVSRVTVDVFSPSSLTIESPAFVVRCSFELINILGHTENSTGNP